MNSKQPAPALGDAIDRVDRVVRYHIQTKHHFNRYARALGYLDWANQPDPFRRFEGAPLLRLPLLEPDAPPVSPSYESIYERAGVEVQPVALHTLSRFFEYALALSAWKRAGETEWPLRSNPSSGNLHPTEGYLIVPEIEGLPGGCGLYHYAPKEHALERRAEFSAEDLAALLRPFPPHAFLFGLTSVHWREAWKYGERAFRYCNHDVGHAVGTARIAAATLGWNMLLVDGMDQATVATLLGTDRTDDFVGVEPEHSDCLAVIWPAPSHTSGVSIPLFLDSGIARKVVETQWRGKANRLSGEHGVHWDIIDDVAAAVWKVEKDSTTIPLECSPYTGTLRSVGTRRMSAGQMIRQRRSAVAFDGHTSISASTFFNMLNRVMPQSDLSPTARPMPWDVWPYEPAIHLLLFVHRVEGLAPGLYFLVRDPRKLPFLQQSMNPELSWQPVPGCPDHLPLYWLLEGDAKRLAAQVSCHQDIAGDSAFSFGMLAEFERSLREHGAWWYPRLFWESGLVGQVLYLESEAAGIRATGIGCFFDDPVHEVVGVKGLALQSLYHFTIGGPVEDRRLITLPPYGHMNSRS